MTGQVFDLMSASKSYFEYWSLDQCPGHFKTALMYLDVYVKCMQRKYSCALTNFCPEKRENQDSRPGHTTLSQFSLDKALDQQGMTSMTAISCNSGSGFFLRHFLGRVFCMLLLCSVNEGITSTRHKNVQIFCSCSYNPSNLLLCDCFH